MTLKTYGISARTLRYPSYIEIIYGFEGWYVLSTIYNNQEKTFYNYKDITANNINTVIRTQSTPAYNK